MKGECSIILSQIFFPDPGGHCAISALRGNVAEVDRQRLKKKKRSICSTNQILFLNISCFNFIMSGLKITHYAVNHFQLGSVQTRRAGLAC